MEDIANYIPIGHQNAISRQQLVIRSGIPDRGIRKAIKESNCLICNLQDGKGYFIPDETEEGLVKAFRAQERRRSLSVTKTVKLCDKWMRQNRKEGNDLEKNQMSLFDFMEGGV